MTANDVLKRLVDTFGPAIESDVEINGGDAVQEVVDIYYLAKEALAQRAESLVGGISGICGRLLNSEEYASMDAIPSVAEEAVEVIHKLATALKATQEALSQSMQHAEKADRFVHQIARLEMWGLANNEDECSPPADGHHDSHACLMRCIEQARGIVEGDQLGMGEDFEPNQGKTSGSKDVIYPKVIVLCINSEGSPEFHACTPAVTHQEMIDGLHYERAKEDAKENGFEGPMIAFDGTDSAARQFGEILVWL